MKPSTSSPTMRPWTRSQTSMAAQHTADGAHALRLGVGCRRMRCCAGWLPLDISLFLSDAAPHRPDSARLVLGQPRTLRLLAARAEREAADTKQLCRGSRKPITFWKQAAFDTILGLVTSRISHAMELAKPHTTTEKPGSPCSGSKSTADQS